MTKPLGAAYFLIAFALFQTARTEPCTTTNKLWPPEFGLTCQDTSIVQGKLLADADNIKINFIKFSPGTIATVPPGLFSRFPNLKELELGRCHVTEIQPNSFTELVKLKYLNLVENELHTVPPSAFETLSRLEKLDLGHNNLSVISKDSFKGLTGLTVMYLRNNMIKDIPAESFRDLALLDGFYIDYNELEVLGPDFLSQAFKVREIDLSHNKITKIDPLAFRGLTGLKHLYLNHNNISSLPVNVFEQLKSLERLRLWHNSLTEFDVGTFSGLHNLQVLELEHNRITVIHENTFAGLVHLERLELQDNQISSFDSGSILKQFQSLTSIKINNNRWNCHDLKNFTETLESRGINFDGGSSFKTSNVDGIRCTNDKAFHVTAEDIKATLIDLNLNEYINNDFKNSSLYSFFNGGYAKSSFSDYVENGFKSSNLYKFFNENFMNSSLYKYLANEHLDTSKGPRTEAFQSSAETTNHDSLYLAFSSIGITMFVIGLIFLVVVFRVVRKRKADDKLTLVGSTNAGHELASVEVP